MALQVPNFPELVSNLAQAVPALSRLVFAFMYLAGCFFIVSAVYKLKHYGDIRTMMSSSAEIKTPLIYFFIGICFLFYPQTVSVGLSTFFNSNTILPYTADASSSSYSEVLEDCVMIVRLVGFIAFFRGFILLSRVGQGNAQPGTFGKALTHIIGGILSINVVAAWNVIRSVIGV